MMLRTVYTFLLCLSACAATWADGAIYAPSSALSKGKWVKIQVGETGFYKLAYSDLRKMGFAEPEKVSIHGYGGWPMEEDFSEAAYLDDVPSIAVYRGDDYILFYGKGATKWSYGSADGFTHENNAYSTAGYYFVTDATETNDAQSISSASGASLQITTYDDYMLHEVDKYSVTTSGRPNSGRDLFGESFSANRSQDFSFSVPGITDDDAKVSYRFIAKITSGGSGAVSLNANGAQLSQGFIAQNNDTYVAAVEAKGSATWSGEKSEDVKITVTFSRSGFTSYLDYIRLHIKRQLQPYGACTFFRSLASKQNVSRFTIQNASSNLLVFDVSEGGDMQRIETDLNGTEASFTIPAADNLREFAMVDVSQTLPTPTAVGEVANQNLHGLEQQDMIILAPAAFVSEAERLAEAHRSKDSLKVAVVTPEQVYNEFSSGTPEATAIRRFMKMFYDRKASADDAPKYLLLFGDGRFDNRGLTSTSWSAPAENYLVTYQSKETISQDSYVSDDYFGLLHDNQGGNITSAALDLGIGRFPVNTLSQAANAVDKIITYMSNENPGPWKNRLCFIADDGNNADEHTTKHMEQSNTLAQYIENNHPEYIVKKLFFDSYEQVYSAGKPSYPDIRTNIQKELKNGVFLVNYTGHGDSESLAEERVITQEDVSNSTYTNLPLWITAACDFAPFDAPATSAGESVFLNKKSGGIALFTTARVAYSDQNFTINRLFLENLFEKENGRRRTLGEVMKNMKNSYNSQEKLSFVMLGDPALTLAYPDYKLEITEINGAAVSDDEPINFKAYEKITIKGEVSSPGGGLASGFSGSLSATVFDSQENITTLDNNNTGNTLTYTDYPNTIYIGNDSIRDGEFSFSFTMPKDISYSYGYGKINLYASSDDGNEANGSYKNFTVGGTAPITGTDTVGPEIRALYLNTTDFQDGGKTNDTPMLGAIVWDESGINVAGSSIGHDITLTIDGNSALNYTLNNYYETYLAGEDGEGIIKFPIPKLEIGSHTAEFKVWDIMNNSSSKTLDFIVSDGYEPAIIDLSAGPVPARESVTFMISHNLPETTMEFEIQVYDMAGRLVWKYAETGASGMFESYKMTWDLKDGAGARMRPGIYVYRAVASAGGKKEASRSKKLIVLAQ